MRTLSRRARAKGAETSAQRAPAGKVKARPMSFGVSVATPLFVRASDPKEKLIESMKARVSETKLRTARRRALSPQRYPVQLQRSYTRRLLELTSALKASAKELLLPRLPSLLKQSAAGAQRRDVRTDADLPAELEVVLGQMRVAIARRFSDEEFEAFLRTLAGQAQKFNAAGIQRQFNSVLGLDVFADEPWLSAAIEGFVVKNVSLVTSIQDVFFNDISQRVLDAGMSGVRWEALADDLTERLGIPENRARLIARDQIGTFNGQLARLRQQSLGINKYQWVSTKDERTREDHRDRDGEIYYWDAETAPRGAKILPPGERPGEPINCRCSAKPVLDDLLAQLESDD